MLNLSDNIAAMEEGTNTLESLRTAVYQLRDRVPDFDAADFRENALQLRNVVGVISYELEQVSIALDALDARIAARMHRSGMKPGEGADVQRERAAGRPATPAELVAAFPNAPAAFIVEQLLAMASRDEAVNAMIAFNNDILREQDQLLIAMRGQSAEDPRREEAEPRKQREWPDLQTGPG